MFSYHHKSNRNRGNECGQGLVEYALILVLVAVVAFVILALFGSSIGGIFSNVVKTLNNKHYTDSDLIAVIESCAGSKASAIKSKMPDYDQVSSFSQSQVGSGSGKISQACADAISAMANNVKNS